MAIISGAHEQVSITGTPISHLPLAGHPECTGLRADGDLPPVVCVEDGVLAIECDDPDTAIAWCNAWQQAKSHLIVNGKSRSGRGPGHV